MYRFPPKKKIDVQGETIEYVVAGAGQPVIVLVNGAGGPIESWFRVFGELAGMASVVAYNRPGVGGSSKPQVAQTGPQLVASLHGLLQALQLPPPYVLVGHSLGGLIVNLYARCHPDEVAGVVLLEATSPDDPEQLARHENLVQRTLRRVFDTLSPQSPLMEIKQIPAIVGALRAAPVFPPVPLKVVTGTRPAMAWATSREALRIRAENQRRLVELSPLGCQIQANRSGHFPQMSEPDLVISAIRKLLAVDEGLQQFDQFSV